MAEPYVLIYIYTFVEAILVIVSSLGSVGTPLLKVFDAPKQEFELSVGGTRRILGDFWQRFSTALA